MQKTLKTLRIILSIRNAVTINSVINGIRNLPVIGKHISEKIYGVTIIKIFALLISVMHELIFAFFGKLCLFAGLFIISLIFNALDVSLSSNAFLYGFVFYSIIAVYIFNCFHTTTETEYAVFDMGMDAKEYVKAVFFYSSFNIVLGYTVFGIPFALLAKVPWFLAILIPISGVGLRAFSLGVEMALYSRKQYAGKKVTKKGVPVSIEGSTAVNTVVVSILSLVGMIFIPILIIYNVFVPVLIIYILSAISIIPGLYLMKQFPYSLYRTALFAEYTKKQINDSKLKKAKNIDKDKLKINDTTEFKTDKKGYALLNQLFFKRHQKIILSRLIWTLIGVLVSIALMSVYLYFEINYSKNPDKSILRYVFTKHAGLFTFVLFAINSGTHMAHAMYANCDSALLNYAFYRKPSSIRTMFRLRNKSVFLYNCIPALPIAIFSIVAVALTGGQEYPLQYVFTFAHILLSVAFFSMCHMFIYYILQPYSAELLVKSKLYNFVSFVSGFFFVILIFIPLRAWMLFVAGLIIVVPLALLSDLLVYKISPKTFRNR